MEENNLYSRAEAILKRMYGDYPGNMALIEKGAFPIDETWDGMI